MVLPPKGGSHQSATRTLIACLNRLSNVVQFVKFIGGSQPARRSELHSGDRDCTAPPADTRRVVSNFVPLALRRDRLESAPTTLVGEKCLHVLSSFQRTGCSTPPTIPALFRRANHRRRSPPGLFPSGEPSYLTGGSRCCQPLRTALADFIVARAVRPPLQPTADASSFPMRSAR